MISEKMAEHEKNGVKFFLAYDYNNNHGGVTRLVEKINARMGGRAKLESLVKEIIPAPDGGKRKKTRYVMVGIPESFFYQKEGVKHLDFQHRAMGYKDETYIETKLAKIVKETLKLLNLAPVEIKYSGVQVITSQDVTDEWFFRILFQGMKA